MPKCQIDVQSQHWPGDQLAKSKWQIKEPISNLATYVWQTHLVTFLHVTSLKHPAMTQPRKSSSPHSRVTWVLIGIDTDTVDIFGQAPAPVDLVSISRNERVLAIETGAWFCPSTVQCKWHFIANKSIPTAFHVDPHPSPEPIPVSFLPCMPRGEGRNCMTQR